MTVEGARSSCEGRGHRKSFRPSFQRGHLPQIIGSQRGYYVAQKDTESLVRISSWRMSLRELREQADATQCIPISSEL